MCTRIIKIITTHWFILFFIQCSQTTENNSKKSNEVDSVHVAMVNPPMEGFNAEESHPIAIVLADKVMKAMGGWKAWNHTRYITWTFFKKRKLLWDKYSGNVRIENLTDNRIVLLNIHDMRGKVFKNGMEQTDTDTLSFYLEWGKKVWVNDSYWLAMPFKLKDSGVTLHYVEESQTLTGEPAQKIKLTFDHVGFTPQNRYDVWISTETNLVTQWSFYPTDSDSVPAWIYPWNGYVKKGGILISEDRGNNAITDVQVLEQVPHEIFFSFDISL